MLIYYVTDAYGRSYYEGQPFASRDAAVTAARQIAEIDRPLGVWIVTDDDDTDDDEEIFGPVTVE